MLHPRPPHPVAIALDAINADTVSDQLSVEGLDLESGRRVRIDFRYIDEQPAKPLSDLVLILSLQASDS